MEKVALKIIEKLEDKLGIVIDYTNETIIPYAIVLAKKYILLNILQEIALIALYSVIIFLFYILVIRIIKAKKVYMENQEPNLFWEKHSWEKGPTLTVDSYMLLIIGAIIVFSISFPLIYSIFNILELIILPELYIYNNLF